MNIILGFLNFCVGVLHPAWSSLEALASEDPSDDAQWLTYWLAYAVLLIFEFTFDFILKVVPLYELVRLVVLLWLTLPYVHGAEWLYESILQPCFHLLKQWLGQAPALASLRKKGGGGGGGGGGKADDTKPAKDQSPGDFNEALKKALS